MFSRIGSACTRSFAIPVAAHWRREILLCIESFPTAESRSRDVYFYSQIPGADRDELLERIKADSRLFLEVLHCSAASAAQVGRERGLGPIVSEIGVERIGRIALRFWLKELLPDRLYAYQRDASTFLLEAVACGSAMRFFSEDDPRIGERAFALGLLHAVGRVVLDRAVRSSGNLDLVFGERTSRHLAKVEFDAFGATHAEVGGLALSHWGFPPQLYRPIAGQFDEGARNEVAGWKQSLAISRFVAERVMESLSSRADPFCGKAQALFRGRAVSQAFEYALSIAEKEAACLHN